MSQTVFHRAALLLGGAALAVIVTGCGVGSNPGTEPSLQPADGVNYPALGGNAPIEIRHAFVLGPAPDAKPYAKGGNAAVYLNIVNQTTKADTLVSATSDAANKVVVGSKQDAMSGASAKANMSNGITVPPTNSQVQAGGPVMVGQPPYSSNVITLTGLTRTLSSTAAVPLTLRFRTAGEITLNVPVMPQFGDFATLSPAPSSSPSTSPSGSPPSASSTPS